MFNRIQSQDDFLGGKFQLLNNSLDDFSTLPLACYGCHWQQKAEKVGIQEEAKQQLRSRGPTSQCTTLLHSGGICQGCISFEKPLILLTMFFIKDIVNGDLVGDSGGSPGLENTLKRWSCRQIRLVCLLRCEPVVFIPITYKGACESKRNASP